MRTSIVRAATAAIVLAMVGGASLGAATHAAAAATNNYTCTTMEFTPAVVVLGRLRVPPQLIGIAGCDIPVTGGLSIGGSGTVTGQVIGWANPRSFSFSGYKCVPGTCYFFDDKLLPKS
jgi:hypothetical protein